MNNKNRWFISSESSKIKDLRHNSHDFHFGEIVYSQRFIPIFAGICQILLGLSVITVAVLKLIQPFWLSTVLCMLGSVTTMIGFYLVYIMGTKSYNPKTLIRNAIRRVMKARN